MFKNVFTFLYRLKHKLFFSVSSFFKTDEQQELLKNISTCLLIWDNQLISLATGEVVELQDLHAETIAQAARQLIPVSKKSKKIPNIALFLPYTEFVATEYSLPKLVTQDLVLALKYQVSELMPAYDGTLLLSVNHNESRDKNIALWLDQQRAETLFSAFMKYKLELTSIIPRTSLFFLTDDAKAIASSGVRQYKEIDNNGVLYVELDKQNIIKWVSISKYDLDNPDFSENADFLSATNVLEINNVNAWKTQQCNALENIPYAFFPESARQRLQKHGRIKKGRIAAIMGIVLIFLLAAPFIKNMVRHAKWENKYQVYLDKTKEVRKMRSAVNEFQDNYALYKDYPGVDVIQIIAKLNKIIPKNSWIQGFELKNGWIEIDGYSPKPTAILEIISKQPEFDHVAFNQRTRTERGKNREHFGIVFHLKGIEPEKYYNKYFLVN